MQDRFAKIISGISSPFLMVATFGLWAVSASVRNSHDFLVFGGLCLFLISGLPLAYILLNIRLGHITDIHVAVREQRSAPFVVATCGAIILGILYHFLHAPQDLVALAITLAVSGTVFGIISGFWKISVHAAAYTGSVLIVAFLVDARLLWLLVFLPLIIWARLVRKRHSPAQAIVATIIITICVTTTLTLFR